MLTASCAGSLTGIVKHVAMTQIRMNQLVAGFLVWQLVACWLVGLNVGPLSEPWTNWNLAFFAFQILLLACVFKKVCRLQQRVAVCIDYLRRRFGHDA